MEINQNQLNQLKRLIVFTVFVVIVGINYQKILLLLRWGIGIISPFLLGLAFAFILNLPMKQIEKNLRFKYKSSWKRPISLLLTILLVLIVLALVMLVVLPEIFQTLWGLQDSIPQFLRQLGGQFQQLFNEYPEIITAVNQIEIDWKGLMEQTVGFLTNGAGTLLFSTMSLAASVVSGAATVGIGFMFSLYVLLQKERLGIQIHHLIDAFLPKKVGSRILEIAALSSDIFSSFLAGQCLEACILGFMFFVVLTVMRLPYALLIGVLIGFTALIPVFGAFIGCVVGAFLMLLSNPMHALTFIIIFFLLQQIEGNLIYPHVVGNSVGLPPIWVLAAVTVGGSMMGVLGMFIFIPICSVVYTMLRQEMHRRLDLKRKEENPQTSHE